MFLKRLAEVCVWEHGGRIPDSYEKLRRLPGIGDYTANAVLSFAFGKRVALWDTNIRRIHSRVFFGKNPSAVPEKQIAEKITQSMPRSNAPAYWGMLMDFGATVCRAKPLCSICPLQKICKAAPKVLALTCPERNRGSCTEGLMGGWRALEGRIVRHPQSRFEGSDRKIRGGIIELLRTKERATFAALAKSAGEPAGRLKKILQGLLRDALIIKKGGAYALPR